MSRIEVDIENYPDGYRVIVRKNGVLRFRHTAQEVQVSDSQGARGYFKGHGEMDVKPNR